MNDLTPKNQSFQTVAKDFWDKEEGKHAKWFLYAVGLALAAAVFVGWGLILPFLIGVIGNTIQLAGLVGVLAVGTSYWWSSNVHLYVNNAFQLSWGWAWKALIKKDPIGMLRNNVANMRDEKKQFDGGVMQLSGSKQRLESDIQAQRDAIVNFKNLSSAADKKVAQVNASIPRLRGNELQEAKLALQRFSLSKQGYLQSAGIADQTIRAEQPILDQTNRMYDQLCRLRDLADFKISSLSQQADMYSKQRETILASQKALGAAGRIIKGDPQQLAIVEQTIEYLNNETADTIGAMKDFNRNSEKYLTDMDLQNDAHAMGAQKIFDQLEQKLSLPDPLTGEMPPIMTVQDSQGVYAPVVTSTSDDDYSKYLK